jgi:serine/threonine protein kinase
MPAERWQRIEELYHAALERAPEERTAFLAEACGDDSGLRREVEELLRYDGVAESFIEENALVMEARQLDAEDLSTTKAQGMTGQQIGAYKILAPLGKGGMGEVHLALDTRLGRKVAVKLLPARFTTDASRVRRFAHEARAASALNHPNIITIHEIGEVENTHYIVTEYVEGETLRQRMNAAPQLRMKPAEAIETAAQIAAALAAAHEAGITHRDIKPENVMVRRDGIVKVLDFGLAKLTEPSSPAVDTQAPTAPGGSTETGVVMGTPRYMSPEQARGEKVDARTDIFSLGVMLYEMIAGRAPFAGATASETIAAILRDQPPPLSRHAPEAPHPLERIVSQAMRKERNERYQVVKDLLLDLKSLKQEIELESLLKGRQAEEKAPPAVSAGGEQTAEIASPYRASSAEYIVSEIKRHKHGVIAIAAALVAALAAAGYWLWPLFGERPATSNATALAPKIRPFTTFPGRELTPNFSPDGNQIAFAWGGEKNENFDIYVKLIDAGAPLRLTNSPDVDDFPAWFPDGRHIAFIRSSEEIQGILTRDSEDNQGIFMVPALGGPEQELLSSRAMGISNLSGLSISADGKTIAFSGRRKNESNSIHLLAVETLETRQLTRPPSGMSDSIPAISPDGKTVAFLRWAPSPYQVHLVPVAGGEPRRLISEGNMIEGLCWTADGSEVIYSFVRVGMGDALFRLPISGGAPSPIAVGGVSILSPAASVRGNRLAWVDPSANTDIWRFETSGRQSRPINLVSSTRQDTNPQISADGKKIVFSSARSGTTELWVSDSDGSNPVPLTSFGGPGVGTPRWSPDGRQIVFDSNAEGQAEIYSINAGGGKPRRLTIEPSTDARPSWSRDGRWIYFGSNRTGGWEVWKMPAEGGAAEQVTKQGGREAFESPDGRFVYYGKGLGLTSLWRVPAAGGEEVKVLEPIMQGYWAVSDQGVWFLNPNVRANTTIEFFNFSTARATRVVTTDKSVRFGFPGFAVSPDGKWLLLALDDQNESDIMVMDNFR